MATGKTRRRAKTSIKVRGYEDEDADVVASIFQQPSVVAGTLHLPHQSTGNLRRGWSSPAPGLYRLVAEIEGIVVGMGAVQQCNQPRQSHLGTLSIAVSEATRRKGVGGTLLDELLELCEGWLRLHRLELDVWVDNEAAIQLFRSREFKIEGVSRALGLREGKLIDSLRMARLTEPLAFARVTAEDVAMRVPPLLTAGPDPTKN